MEADGSAVPGLAVEEVAGGSNESVKVQYPSYPAMVVAALLQVVLEAKAKVPRLNHLVEAEAVVQQHWSVPCLDQKWRRA